MTPFPHYVVIDLGQERELGSFTYVPRQADANPRNGQIRDYHLEAATVGTWTYAWTSGWVFNNMVRFRN